MPGIEVGFGCAPAIVGLLLLFSAAASFLLYRYTTPPTSRLRRILLALLRGAALFLLLALLCEPVVRFVRTTTTPPALAVIVDNTASMRLQDRTIDRATTVRSVLASPTLDRIAGNATVQFYRFSTSLHPIVTLTPDSLRLEDEGTDLSEALRSLAAEQQQRNIQAALLVTDGAYTRGQNPVYMVEGYPIPLFPVPIGDSTEQKDIAITRISANATVFAGTQTPVEVTVKSTGYNAQLLEVTLLDGSTVLDRQSLRTEAGTHEYALPLSYTPEGDGVKRLSVRVSSLPDELTPRNNRRSFTMRIRKSRLLILMIAGSPSPDVAIIRQTLAEQPDFNVRSFTQQTSSGFYEGTISAGTLDSADCLILLDIPTTATSSQTMDLIRNQLLVLKKPCLFIGGRKLDHTRLDLLNQVLPFSVEAPSTAEQEVFFTPTPSERSHPLLTLGTDTDLSVWGKLPPIFRTRSLVKPRPGTRVLGTAMQQRVTVPDPLMVVRSMDRQKILAFPCYGLWRWRLMAQGSPETSTFLFSFLTTSVKWLTTPEESRSVIVAPFRDAFSQGEPINFQGQVYDQTLKPFDNAQVLVRVRRDTLTEETVLRPMGSGRYEGSIAGLTEGTYTFRALATSNGSALGADSGRFAVGGLEEEFVETRMNAFLLRLLAQKSGGRVLPPENIDSLAAALAALPAFVPRVESHATTIDLRTWYILAGFIILLLAAEWVIRRRAGML